MHEARRAARGTPTRRYPRARLDALSDGVFAVAMTLLVLDLRLPDDFHPTSDEQLLRELIGLWPKMLPYLLSFCVLGLRWLAGVQLRSREELQPGGAYVKWWLLFLLLVTCVPFTTIVVGRYAGFAPAVWLYAGNTALIALAAWRQLALTPGVDDDDRRDRQQSLALLFVSALLCIAWSLLSPRYSLLALALNGAAPWLARSRLGRGNADRA